MMDTDFNGWIENAWTIAKGSAVIIIAYLVSWWYVWWRRDKRINKKLDDMANDVKWLMNNKSEKK